MSSVIGYNFLVAKLSYCQIVRCQIVHFLILLPNCPFAVLVPNCPFLLSWCQIVRCQIIRVPNCPITHIWKQHISKRGFPFLEWLIFCWSAQTGWFADGKTFSPHLWCQKWWWRCSGWPSGEQLSHWALCSSHALDSTLFPLFSLFAEYLQIGINSYLMEWESGREGKWWIQERAAVIDLARVGWMVKEFAPSHLWEKGEVLRYESSTLILYKELSSSIFPLWVSQSVRHR